MKLTDILSDLYEAKPCWAGYRQLGMKMKNGRQVPNCIPINEEEVSPEHQREMVVGIAEIVRGVKDINNRKELAKKQIKQLKAEGIEFDVKEFLSLCGFKSGIKEESNLSQTKIVDETGEPLVVYRSQEDQRTQGIDRQSDTKGIYFSANVDSTKIYGSITKKYHLDIKNPLILKDKEWNLSVLPSYYYDMLVKKGYDGAVWLRQGEMYEIIAFYPDQIIPILDDSIDEYDVETIQEFQDFKQFIREYATLITEASCNCITEAEYHGRKVQLGKPMQGDIKKFKVFVENPAGKVVKVNFGQKGMVIKKNNPKRRKSFRARMHCDNPGPRTKANYWSCRAW